ncbi:FAD-binding protein [Streptomyces sp. NWU49]|uniref:FAD-binding protein n=1 Tax=Streptomyces sp. NWU49 TaxID=2201153 RepID=UPI00215A493C|nr:FAD-binding protein [Streptomyces sp. NWU49]
MRSFPSRSTTRSSGSRPRRSRSGTAASATLTGWSRSGALSDSSSPEPVRTAARSWSRRSGPLRSPRRPGRGWSGAVSGSGAGTRHCDVLVAGGGPAGCVAALSLARAGTRVVIVAPVASPGWRVGESLAPAARPLLERLGCSTASPPTGTRPAAAGQQPLHHDCLLLY